MIKATPTKDNFVNTNYLFDQDMNGKILIIGIGGGSDIIGAYGLGKFLKNKYPKTNISIGVAITPKTSYEGFDLLYKNIYQCNQTKIGEEVKLHHTLRLIKNLNNADASFPIYGLVRTKYQQGTSIEIHKAKVAEIIKSSLTFLNPDKIIAVDNGGDSLTGGVSDNVEKEFDRTGIRALQKFGKPFEYMVFSSTLDCVNSEVSFYYYHIIDKVK